MADIYLDNGEIIPTMFSDITVVNGDDEILQMAIHSIRTFFGENEYHPEIGNKIYTRRLKVLDSGADTIVSDCTSAILQDDRVRSVDEMSVYYDKENKHNLEVEFTLTTSTGSVISGTVQIQI